MRTLCLLSLFFLMHNGYSQEEHPFRQIQENDTVYTASSVLTRMMDGLGFRYYWATEGLKADDLKYRPSTEGRDLLETLQHLHGLSRLINLTSRQEVNQPEPPPSDFSQLREETLEMLWEARMNLARAEDLANYPIRFKNGSEFAFWNLISGPISDAVWHCGQIVLLRRANGNPLPAGVSFFRGTYKKPTATD